MIEIPTVGESTHSHNKLELFDEIGRLMISGYHA